MYIIGAILAFSVLILVHELGHFTLAKINGVKVEEFSIGMGPKLFGISGKDTNYVIKALPIGGYIRMLGEESESTDERAFSNKSPLRKLTIIAAGPFMNFVLAVIIFSVIASARGYLLPVVSGFTDNSPAKIAGIQPGDKILKVNNKKIMTWEELPTELYTEKGNPINLQISRKGTIKNYSITPIKSTEENRYIIGIYPEMVTKPAITQSISYGFTEVASLVKQTGTFLAQLVRGKVSSGDVGGPVTIIRVSGEAAKAGLLSLMAFIALISVQLGIFNIIPFPALDGGWIFLLLFEIVTGKKVDDSKVGIINYIGFMILMGLMIVVTVKDILYPIKF